jgi:hypothetical protein
MIVLAYEGLDSDIGTSSHRLPSAGENQKENGVLKQEADQVLGV